MELSVGVEPTSNGAIWLSLERAKVLDLTLDSSDRANDWVSREAMGYSFISDGVFLVGVDHRDGPRGSHGFQGCVFSLEHFSSQTEFNIVESERIGECVFVSGVEVFARSTEEIETDDAHVGNGNASCSGGVESDVLDNSDGDRLATLGRGVQTFPSCKESGEPVLMLARACQSFVFGPHAGHRLADGTYGVLHCSSCDGLTAFCKTTVSVSLGKDLEVGDRIFDIFQKGVDFVFCAKSKPDIPGVILASGTFRTDASSAGFRCKQQVSAECISRRRWQRRHG